MADSNAPGVSVSGQWNGLGVRGNSSRPVTFDGVKVRPSQILGETGDQIWYVFEVVTPYFLTAMAGTYLGIAQAALEIAINHVKGRSYAALGESLADAPVIQHQIAEMWTKVEQARQLVYRAARLDEALQRCARKFAENAGAKVYVCDRLSELPEALPQIQSRLSLAIFSLHFLDVIEAARLFHSAAPLAEIIFLCTSSQEESVRSQLGHAPRIGSHWRYADPDDPAFAKTLQVSYSGGEQRRTVRTTLDRFNGRLTTEAEAVDPHQLRKLVISDRFLASVLEHGTEAVLSVDTENRIIGFNPAAADPPLCRAESARLRAPLQVSPSQPCAMPLPRHPWIIGK